MPRKKRPHVTTQQLVEMHRLAHPRDGMSESIVHVVPSPSANVQAVIESMVRKRVDEVLSASGMVEIGDTFRPAEVAKAQRRVNHVYESRKWGMYFEKWGCLICGKKTVNHFTNGQCQACGLRTNQRLQGIKRDFEAAHPEAEIERNIDQLTLRARSAEELFGRRKR